MTFKSEKYIHVFENVTALYFAIKEVQQFSPLPLRRASLRNNGEVYAESLDFICDVELKAKRVLSRPLFELFVQGVDLPVSYKSRLGEMFAKCRLSLSGDYKTLYFQTKKVVEENTSEYVTPTVQTLEEHDKRDK